MIDRLGECIVGLGVLLIILLVFVILSIRYGWDEDSGKVSETVDSQEGGNS